MLFAGYKNPHPLEHKIILRVQTTPETSPSDAVASAINDLMAELSLLEERFIVSLTLYMLHTLCLISDKFIDLVLGRYRGVQERMMHTQLTNELIFKKCSRIVYIYGFVMCFQ